MKIQKSSYKARSDQFYVYLPKTLVEAMGWRKSDDLSFEVLGKDKLKLEKSKKSSTEKHRGDILA